MATQANEITSESVIEWVLTAYPGTVSVFLNWRMQCVGCPIARFESIADACRIHQRPMGPFLSDLRSAALPVASKRS